MSGDLRAQFESLAHDLVNDHRGIPYDVIRDIDAIVASIPEGAVLVTEETLAAALEAALAQFLAAVEADAESGEWSFQKHAAAILRHVREGT